MDRLDRLYDFNPGGLSHGRQQVATEACLIECSIGEGSRKEKRMEELVREMSGKLGISEETAEQGVHIVLEFIKKKLPPEMAEQVDSLVTSSGTGAPSGFASIVGKVFGH